MRFTILAALSLVSLVAAIPSPQASDKCYDTCLGDLFCIQSWPEGCLCGNANKVKCAEKCKIAAPKLQDCGDVVTPTISVIPMPTVIKPDPSCYKKCVGERACIQVYPQSCYCENGIKADCAAKCGLRVALTECPPLETKIVASNQL